MLDRLKRILFIIIQCTWGIVPTIIGFVSLFWGSHPYFVKLREVKKLRYTSCFVEAWASRWGELITGDTAIWD